MRGVRISLALLLAAMARADVVAANPASLVDDALAAEARLETRRALDLLLEAEKLRRDDAFILRKIARQYSDLVVDLAEPAKKRESVERALGYAQRAVALESDHAENILSVAICYGQLALHSGNREKVDYSRRVRAGCERALALDPGYAWAHHILGRWHHEVSELGSASKVFVRLFYGGLPKASTADAVRHLERAVELEPTQLQHWLELGVACLAHGDTTRARSAFATGLVMPSREKHDEPAKQRARAAVARL